MGLLSRMSTIFKAKVSNVLDRAEDPRETLEYSYQKQVEQLQNIRRGVAEVVTSKKRLELQLSRLEQQVQQWDQDARDAVAAGRDDLAQQAISRKQAVQAQIEPLRAQIEELAREEARLTDLQQKLALKVDAFRTQKEVIKAQYSAAQAQVKIGEATTGLGEDMADLALALQRAQDKTESLRARAAAVDELAEKGVLALEAGNAANDPIRDELKRLQAHDTVAEELAKLKAEMGKGESV